MHIIFEVFIPGQIFSKKASVQRCSQKLHSVAGCFPGLSPKLFGEVFWGTTIKGYFCKIKFFYSSPTLIKCRKNESVKEAADHPERIIVPKVGKTQISFGSDQLLLLCSLLFCTELLRGCRERSLMKSGGSHINYSNFKNGDPRNLRASLSWQLNTLEGNFSFFFIRRIFKKFFLFNPH